MSSTQFVSALSSTGSFLPTRVPFSEPPVQGSTAFYDRIPSFFQPLFDTKSLKGRVFIISCMSIVILALAYRFFFSKKAAAGPEKIADKKESEKVEDVGQALESALPIIKTEAMTALQGPFFFTHLPREKEVRNEVFKVDDSSKIKEKPFSKFSHPYKVEDEAGNCIYFPVHVQDEAGKVFKDFAFVFAQNTKTDKRWAYCHLKWNSQEMERPKSIPWTLADTSNSLFEFEERRTLFTRFCIAAHLRQTLTVKIDDGEIGESRSVSIVGKENNKAV